MTIAAQNAVRHGVVPPRSAPCDAQSTMLTTATHARLVKHRGSTLVVLMLGSFSIVACVTVENPA